jgi:hypothetical protein
MKDSKLIQTLLHLNKPERNRFKKFLISPFFNSDENMISIFDFIDDHISKNHNEFPEKQVLWKKIFKGIPFDDIRLRKYFSDLFKLLTKFLSFDLYQRDPIVQDLFLLEVINERKLISLTKSSVRSARIRLEANEFRHSQAFLQRYSLERNNYEIQNLEGDRNIRSNIEEINESLDIFYLSEKLRLFCKEIELQILAKHKYKLTYIEEILNMIKLKGYENVPSILLYSKLLNLYMDSANEENYFSLRQSVSENNPLFPKKELAEIYSTMINYCSLQINKGNSKFLAQLFDFYKEVVSQDILLEDQSFSPYHFKNIVVIGLRLKEFNWIEAFINDFAPLLPENQRDNSLSFNLAQLYFYQKKYDLVIKTLQSVEYDDYVYNLNSKTMLICTYYDTGETDALFFLFDSFRAFLNRNNDIPEARKELYRNFVSFSKKLARLTPKDEKAKQKLTFELEQTKNIASKNWLLEKLAEL